MAKKITISGEIGWAYTVADIRASLDDAGGADLDVDLVTPGGDVFEGIEIYNAIRDYKRKYPKAQIMGTLKGLVASMGTVIASCPAFDLVAAEDNAVFMIHNAWSCMCGDYRDMQKMSDMLEGLTSLMSDTYVQRTGKKKEEIRSMMDEETWLFGSEIKDAGFVDEMVPCPDDACGPSGPDKKKKALSLARGSFDAMKRHAQEKTDAQKVAAMVQAYNKVVAPGVPGEKNIPESQGGQEMFKTLAEFKTGEPALYTEFESGVKAAAVAEERSRIVALLDMKKKYGEKVGAVAERCDKAISDGENAADIALAVMALVTAALESTGPLNTGASGSVTGEENPVAESVHVNQFQ